MGRKRVFFDYAIPSTVVNIVQSICADYDRRIRCIGNKRDDVAERYRMLNDAIDNALADIEIGVRDVLLSDICLGRGYNHSPASAILTKSSYYSRKRKIIHDIAEELLLL